MGEATWESHCHGQGYLDSQLIQQKLLNLYRRLESLFLINMNDLRTFPVTESIFSRPFLFGYVLVTLNSFGYAVRRSIEGGGGDVHLRI